MCSLSVHAKQQYPFQSENPIANFAWNENDTTRYEGHYRFENAYRMTDMQKGRSFRNFATQLGSIIAGKGTSFNIYYYGQGKVK